MYNLPSMYDIKSAEEEPPIPSQSTAVDEMQYIAYQLKIVRSAVEIFVRQTYTIALGTFPDFDSIDMFFKLPFVAKFDRKTR
jgi:hypothetical protein